MTVALIASGQFVNDGLAAEFGNIPPSFLPLGNRRLYMRQIELLRRYGERIYISLPDGYAVPEADEAALADLGVQIIRTDPALSIGAALSLCANIIGAYEGRLVVLYGDTLIEDSALPADAYSMHAAYDHQSWAAAPIGGEPMEAGEGRMVVSGLFSFSDIPLLLRSIALENNRFLRALVAYDRERSLTAAQDGQWYDFGHVQTYYTSCGLITTQRSFNQISISANWVEKLSDDHHKMDAEANWLETIPYVLRGYTAPFLGRISTERGTGYRTANTYLATLANLAVFGHLNVYAWTQIFDACGRFLVDANALSPPGSQTVDLFGYYQGKTEKRLRTFAGAAPHPIDEPLCYEGHDLPSMLDRARIAGGIIEAAPPPTPGIIHGDFCFSNIFYDFRSRSIKLIDPRGLAPDGAKSIYGDPRYDVAKLAHSVIGGYDMIIAGRVRGRCDKGHLSLDMGALSDERWRDIVTAFEHAKLMDRHSPRVIIAILVQLFLSMLPLHADNPGRQEGFLANAARLFLKLEA
ncbi:hypothetical protein EGM87_12030 [Sphingobium sp. RSMS]|uniref:hypothetical protein n=1 Tax=Sphingobium sp. RSMS TaxID=520734 RepID=UPI0010F5CFB1|nr:hypothetical protein [Sphingobium sp. RSMS]UXC89787.1 hypothetical protein EGM87_12030 [Sphingobium sp. RSMS]